MAATALAAAAWRTGSHRRRCRGASHLAGVRKAGRVGLPLPGIDVGLVDRQDRMLPAGEAGIEDVLYAHPAVLEAAVVGQPDAVFGEQPVAFVALRPGRSIVPDDLIEHCRRSLARYKVPRSMYIEETLPKNAVGKIAKPMLRERLRA